MQPFSKERILTIVSLAIGVFTFCFFCDISILNPTNYKWLMLGDPSQHYLGWETFRSTPLLQWPLGLNYNYGMETSSSIVFTDSIPLVAITLKYFNNLLPVNFQYTGMWLLACFMLQSYFGYRIVKNLIVNNTFSLICGFILSFAPMFIVRTQNHYALCAQFLILASFLLYLSKSNNKKWTLLICISALVHAYLLVMILIVYTTSVLVNSLESKNSKRGILNFIVSVLLCAFVMYSAGYFVVSNGISSGGYGIYRADLLTFFNPVDQYLSRFSRINNNQLTNGEGLGYIGFGLIMSFAALFSAAIIAMANKNHKKLKFIIPAISIFLVYLFAVSNVVSLQGYEILRVGIPHKIEGLLNIFRAGGRFIWIVVYALMIACFASVFSQAKRGAVLVIALLAIVQFADVSRFRMKFDSVINKASNNAEKISSQHYNVDYNKYDRIVMLPPRDFTDKSPIIYLAAINRLPVNSGYMARYDVIKEKNQNDNLKYVINKKELDGNSIYLIGRSASSLRSLCGKGYACEDGHSGTMIYKTK